MHTTLLIFNPQADRGRSGQRASALRAMVEEMGGADWQGTEYPTHATEIAAASADRGYTTVVSLGGDGTAHEVINGLMRVPPDRRPRLGLVPIGSGNDFAHAVGVPDNPQEAIRRAFSGTPVAVDLVALRDGGGRCEYFQNTAGIGFDAAVNLRTRKLRRVYGFVMYLTATLQSIALNFDAPRMRVTYDDGELDRPLMMLTVGNGPRQGGGFIVTPAAKLDDGVLDFVYVDKVSQLRMLLLLPKFMNGTQGSEPDVHLARTRRLVIEADRAVPVHADGEVFAPYEANVRRVEIEVVPGAVQIMR
jgi:YegS/Rv2252/BmrU family lipid kinase